MHMLVLYAPCVLCIAFKKNENHKPVNQPIEVSREKLVKCQYNGHSIIHAAIHFLFAYSWWSLDEEKKWYFFHRSRGD